MEEGGIGGGIRTTAEGLWEARVAAGPGRLRAARAARWTPGRRHGAWKKMMAVLGPGGRC